MMQTKLDRLSYYDRLSYRHRAWHLEDCVESVCVAGVLIIRRLTALVEEISEEDNDIRLEVSADSTKPTRQVPTDDRYLTDTYRRQVHDRYLQTTGTQQVPTDDRYSTGTYRRQVLDRYLQTTGTRQVPTDDRYSTGTYSR